MKAAALPSTTLPGLERDRHHVRRRQRIVRHAARLDHEHAGLASTAGHIAERPHDQPRLGQRTVGPIHDLAQLGGNHAGTPTARSLMVSRRFITIPRSARAPTRRRTHHAARDRCRTTRRRPGAHPDRGSNRFSFNVVIRACASFQSSYPPAAAPAVTAAETAAPSAGVCGDPATSIGWPMTSA